MNRCTSVVALSLSLSLIACGKEADSTGSSTYKPPAKPVKIDALTLTPLPDKKLAVSFRLLDADGKGTRSFHVGYKVLGCDVGPNVEFDASKDQLATLTADLEFCGAPPADHKVKLDLKVDDLAATAEVDAKASYVRSAPRSLDELPTELARLSTAGMTDTDVPFETRTPEIGLIDLVVDRIVEMEAPAIPKLTEAWKTGPSQVNARVAAAAIGKLDPALLVKDTLALLDAYDAALAADPAAGRVSATARAAAAGLYASERLDFDLRTAADIHFRALSSPDPQLSGLAATWIKTALPRDMAIDGLFRYMAAKDKYNQREIDIYVAVIERFGPEASASVAKNLEALLAAARKPDKVFWAHKVVGLTALAKVGQAPAVPTIEKFKADKEAFVSTKQPIDAMGNPTGMEERKHVAFATLADQALAAIAGAAPPGER
ncbi:MAG TPA: hypothetical protein VM261_36125 [Kofleriaceae bacterium]|nr:hypothetical protein [Kofleriaceae bacterium]